MVSWTRLDDGASQWRHFTRSDSVFSGAYYAPKATVVRGRLHLIVDPTDKPSMDLGTSPSGGRAATDGGQGQAGGSHSDVATQLGTRAASAGEHRRNPAESVVSGCPLSFIRRFSPFSRRLVIVVGGVMTFLFAASVFEPFSSKATDLGPLPNARIGELRTGRAAAMNSAGADPTSSATEEVVRGLTQLTHPKGWHLLGALVGRDHIVLIHASSEGARYSVFSLDGRLLEADLFADDVYRSFPDLEIDRLRLDPAHQGRDGVEGPYMLVPPDGTY